MKFHCDRCKTRYSIADERVRGKILKIRCKNCSAVITVREGGQAAAPPRTPADAGRSAAGASGKNGAAGAGSGRLGTSAPTPAARPGALGRAHSRPQTPPPVRAGALSGGASALQGAFHQALRQTGPEPSAADSVSGAPATLEAEWYVSVDGDQQGPFTLAQAQDWVLERELDEELYCWSEGFDDWLPVEKVSHFRGLRGEDGGRPDFGGDERTVVDAPPGAGGPGGTAPPREDTPVPLFAATMAKMAAEAPTEINEEVEARFPNPLARRNGASNGAAAAAPALPRAAAGPVVKASLPPPRPVASASGPGAAGAPEYRGGVLLNEPSADAAGDGGLDLEIGEASRVVKLPMLARNMGNAGAGPARAPGLPGMDGNGLGRGSGSFDQIPSASAGAVNGGTGSLPVIQAGSVEMPRPELLQPIRRGRSLVLPIALAGAALVALVAVLLVVALSGDEDDDQRLARGQVGGVDLAYQFGGGGKEGRGDSAGEPELAPETGAAGKEAGGGKRVTRRATGQPTAATSAARATPAVGFGEVDLSGGGASRSLDPSDLMTVYKSNRIGVTLCYNSALKKDPLLKVQKAVVSIDVATSGKVRSVSIPGLRGSELGTCLERRIKAWRFPKSTSGLASQFPIIFDS